MRTLLIVIHLMIVSAMIGLVLLQKSEGGGLGMGGGGGGFATGRGAPNVPPPTHHAPGAASPVLARPAAFRGAAFCSPGLPLSILAGIDRKPRSILQGNDPAAP